MVKKFNMFLVLIILYNANVYGIEEIDLKLHEWRYISQNGEDGVLQKIFDIIGVTNKYYVDFGAGNGHYASNVKYFKEAYGWEGLLLEGIRTAGDPSINLHPAFITAENICDIFKQHNVPSEFDLISIDIDGNDFYVWQALSAQYKPRVVVIEFNRCFNYDEDKVMAYDANYRWDSSEYCGASICALYNLGRSLGYSLVYQESSGANLFFIRDDALEQAEITFKNSNDVAKLYNAIPMKLDPRRRLFISSAQAMKR